MNATTASHVTPESPPVITVENVVAYYGDRRILNEVSMAVHPGEIMVIMGGSGSGKSTLLRHLLALQRPRSGSIRMLDHDLTTATPLEMLELRRKIGVAFQFGALLSSLTVGENIMLPLKEHTRLDQATMEVMLHLKLEVVGLAGFEHLTPAELSGGMTKRAALARAIIMDPQLLFLDEPSAGLDPVVAAALDDLILELRDATGMTMVVVTHELDSAFKIADRITVLDKGEVVETGSVEDVRNSPNHRVQNLLNRRTEEIVTDVDEYLERLTGLRIDQGR